MNTEVPNFREINCWDQYKQVFDTIVRSNWWDDDTVALQLLSHIEGDALNVALLVPEAQRATRIGLISALNDHCDSRGNWQINDVNSKRLSVGTVWTRPYSKSLETLAVKAFGNIGPSARVWMIHDWFVTGHQDCDLWRHLDSVPSGASLRDIVDRCRVWESHANADDQGFIKPAPERTRSLYTVRESAVMPAHRVVAAIATFGGVS